MSSYSFHFLLKQKVSLQTCFFPLTIYWALHVLIENFPHSSWGGPGTHVDVPAPSRWAFGFFLSLVFTNKAPGKSHGRLHQVVSAGERRGMRLLAQRVTAQATRLDVARFPSVMLFKVQPLSELSSVGIFAKLKSEKWWLDEVLRCISLTVCETVSDA